MRRMGQEQRWGGGKLRDGDLSLSYCEDTCRRENILHTPRITGLKKSLAQNTGTRQHLLTGSELNMPRACEGGIPGISTIL